MTEFLTTISSVRLRCRLFVLYLLVILGAFPMQSFAHPMPSSIVLMDITQSKVVLELQLPLSQLDLAFGHNVAANPASLISHLSPELKQYLISHIRPKSSTGGSWKLEVPELSLRPAEQSNTGVYQELSASVVMYPPVGSSTRKFDLYYDVIIHQLVTHSALVSIRSYWEAGVSAERPVELGVISLDAVNNNVPPLKLDIEGSKWTGFKSMVVMGMQHISEGTDHLMFLLVLLLPAMLLVSNGKWRSFGGIKFSLTRLLKIVTAFTIGHSLTLLAGTLGWFKLPIQLVEVSIAVSILISAVHAIRPIFSGRELYIALLFGLVHGLAFASTLTNLQLDGSEMALSILGFNIGIELMQLVVVGVTIPWLILLSQTSYYKFVRIGGAFVAAVASIAWIMERFSGKPNMVTMLIVTASRYATSALLPLGILAITLFYFKKRNHRYRDIV